uniref:Uncharacterized protein n=1 Tax=Quercus lobata TaxID=97700 RepID=A0A7N2LM67_QUELO
MASHFISNPRSHAVSTERTILSPFTKEYRVHAANSGIRQFLEEFSDGEAPKNATPFFFNKISSSEQCEMPTSRNLHPSFSRREEK